MDGQNQAKSIFLAAIEKPADQRDSFVTEASAGNTTLCARVRALLRAHDDPDPFLNEPAAKLDAMIEPPSVPMMTEQPGTIIGRYKLLEQIGEGGMGVVYMAEQQSPVRRRVAIKIIKSGMDTRQVVARFEAERQALALMEHANIARVLDGGSTDTGKPYFVMELVRGIPITEYCDQNNLALRQRLELFVEVCHAIQHAHQKGIIHRDLKPSNILVTVNDGRPVPKVIDFGVAKAVDQPLTEKTLFTAFAQMVGTPLYMSPEQAEMTSLDIDTRSDIYSLGVLLYELLTGTTPFDQQRMREAAFDEMRRIIREEEPPRPSTRISTMGERRIVTAARRKIDAERLAQSLKGDLDWIVMKSLEKDRTRRYDSATGIADDIGRYLANEPVEARRPTGLYRLRKFVQRNKLGVIAGGCIVLALVLGLATAAYFAAVASQEAKLTKAALAQAESSHRDAQGVNKFFTEEVFGLADPNYYDRAGITVVHALDIASTKVDSKFPNDPSLRAEIHERFGEIYLDIYRPKEAVDELREAVRLRTELADSRNPATLRSRYTLGFALYQAYRWKECERTLRSTWEDQCEVLGPGSREAAHTAARLACLLKELRGWLNDRPGVDPLPFARTAYQNAIKTLGPDEEATLDIEDEMAWILRWQGKNDEAFPHAQHAALGLRKLKGSVDPLAMSAHYNYLVCLQGAGRLDEALAEVEMLLKIQMQVLGPLHDETLCTTWKRAHILVAMGRKAEAVASFDVILPHLDEIGAAGNPKSIRRLLDVSKVFRDAGRKDRALTLLATAARMYGRVDDDVLREHPDMLSDLAEELEKLGNKEAASQMRNKLDALQTKNPSSTLPTAASSQP